MKDYELRIVEVMDVYVDNGEIKKSRGFKEDVNIEQLKDNFGNIAIKDGDKIDVYCSEVLMYRLMVDRLLNILVEQGKVTLHNNVYGSKTLYPTITVLYRIGSEFKYGYVNYMNGGYISHFYKSEFPIVDFTKSLVNIEIFDVDYITSKHESAVSAVNEILSYCTDRCRITEIKSNLGIYSDITHAVNSLKNLDLVMYQR